MAKKLHKIIILVALIFFSISKSYALDSNQENICNVLRGEKKHVAYLLNKDGKISGGPIEYGKWIDDGKSEEALIVTHYKMMIYPARTKFVNNDCFDYGCLKLTKTSPTCKGATTYDVSVRLIFRRKKNEFYQYTDDTEFLPLVITDPTENYDPELKYQFLPRIKGSVDKP